ncbi:hypothetical protein GSbR_30690 [Geobacter sp. SVR]|nr:hypothetical protein GSVR_30310 [Geobacter sp. SVR]GCF86469.1 hypothetical protein GSbR_30690 [Geobacter sp. SVR]
MGNTLVDEAVFESLRVKVRLETGGIADFPDATERASVCPINEPLHAAPLHASQSGALSGFQV